MVVEAVKGAPVKAVTTHLPDLMAATGRAQQATLLGVAEEMRHPKVNRTIGKGQTYATAWKIETFCHYERPYAA